MSQLDATQKPELMIERGLVVGWDRGLAKQLSTRLELRPRSSHLVVGGIGSGKTTELLLAADALNASSESDVRACYLDVGAHQDLAKLRTGTVMALAGIKLSESSKTAKVRAARKEFESWAKGYWSDPDYDQDDVGDSHWVEGVVDPPETGLNAQIMSHIDDLKTIAQAFAAERASTVVLIDSLDRISDKKSVMDVIDHDIKGLIEAGVGVVLVGPIRLLFGINRLSAEAFDQIYRVTSSDSSDTFLEAVLQKRTSGDTILPAPLWAPLAKNSGGIVRDLLSIAHLAVEEAWVDGAEVVSQASVDKAVRTFGRTLALGLSIKERMVLSRLHAAGHVSDTGEVELGLLATRRIVERDGRFMVHPALVSHIE